MEAILNVFQRSVRAGGWMGIVCLFMLTLSACNLNTTPEEEIEPLTTATPSPQPSETFTLTPLPVVPSSTTPADSEPTLIPLTTQSGGDDVVPVGVRTNPTPNTNTNVGTFGGNVGSDTGDNSDNPQATDESGDPSDDPLGDAFPETFSDRYTATVGEGRTLLVNYLVELRESGVGQVFFLVNNPNGDEVARWIITESAEDTQEILVEVGGEYEILVAFENLRGYYSVDFDTR